MAKKPVPLIDFKRPVSAEHREKLLANLEKARTVREANALARKVAAARALLAKVEAGE